MVCDAAIVAPVIGLRLVGAATLVAKAAKESYAILVVGRVLVGVPARRPSVLVITASFIASGSGYVRRG